MKTQVDRGEPCLLFGIVPRRLHCSPRIRASALYTAQGEGTLRNDVPRSPIVELGREYTQCIMNWIDECIDVTGYVLVSAADEEENMYILHVVLLTGNTARCGARCSSRSWGGGLVRADPYFRDLR